MASAPPNLSANRHRDTMKGLRWASRQTIDRNLVIEALLKASRARKPRGSMIHSDQRAQYGSDNWRRFFRSHSLVPSMSRKASCWYNAIAESFFNGLKVERLKNTIFRDCAEVLADLAEYIETFYNPVRRHSHHGGLGPQRFEATHKRPGQVLH